MHFSQCSFLNTSTSGHGGIMHITAPTLTALQFTSSGKGFTFYNYGNGGYECDPFCTPKPDVDKYLGQALVIELTDNTVATPFGSASPQLIGLSNIQLNGSTSHVIGWECILPLCTVSDAALVAPYTLTQTEPKELGSVLPPISWSSLECELIDGSVDGAGCGIDNEAREADGRDICNLIVKNGVQLCVTVIDRKSVV